MGLINQIIAPYMQNWWRYRPSNSSTDTKKYTEREPLFYNIDESYFYDQSVIG